MERRHKLNVGSELTAGILLSVLASVAWWQYGANIFDVAHRVSGSKFTAEKLGAWGDSFGALNALFSSLGLAALITTLLYQVNATRDQQDDQHRQRFDSSFLQLLSLQRELREKIRFSADKKVVKAIEAGSYSTFSSATTGPMEGGLISDPVVAACVELHYNLVVPISVNAITLDILVSTYMKYVHSVSEATIAPYFRLIYSMLDRVRADTILRDEEKIRYANLVRAQMSSSDALLLGFNSLAPISADMRELVSEFRMLKYVPPSKMKDILKLFHDPISFLGRDNENPKSEKIPNYFSQRNRYRAVIAALHAERLSMGISQEDMSILANKPADFVEQYEDGVKELNLEDFIDAARATKKHPAYFLRY